MRCFAKDLCLLSQKPLVPKPVVLLLASRLRRLHTFADSKCDICENSSLVYAVCLLLTCRKTVILLFGRPGAPCGSTAFGAWVRVLLSGVTFGSQGLFLRRAADYRESLVSSRAGHTFAFRADALERLGALFPFLGSVPELDVGFP